MTVFHFESYCAIDVNVTQMKGIIVQCLMKFTGDGIAFLLENLLL